MSKRSSNPIDAFFDFLGDLVAPRAGPRTPDGRPADPPPTGTAEEREAWEELNDWLRNGKTRAGAGGPRGGSASGNGRGLPPSLDQDYANLELPPGADFSLVKAAYKRLLRHYHPDRHSENPQKQRIATQITQKLNASYRRIKDHAGGAPPN